MTALIYLRVTYRIRRMVLYAMKYMYPFQTFYL